ncbi:MAG TPA: methyltransferase domain-containing protein [Candidatus Tectomicrobia bacterium]
MNWAAFKTLWLPPRSLQQEWLDTHDISPQDLQRNLDDLRWLNRYLGSHWLLCTALRRVWRKLGCPRHLHVLDVGTGAGDMPTVMRRWGEHHGVHIAVVAVDSQNEVLQYMRSIQPRPLASVCLQADGLCLPFRARTFDVVLCSTMLHHLDWQQGIALLQSMAAVARHAVVVNDLVRSRLHYYAARLLLSVMACHPVTRHDGALSVLRAYSVGEVREMARLAGLVPAHLSTVLGYRFVLVYEPPTQEKAAPDGA